MPQPKSSTWEGALADALNDIDMIGGELSWRVSDLYARQGVTGRQRLRLILLSRRLLKSLNDLTEIRASMGLPDRPE